MSIIVNYIVGQISSECKIPEREIRDALASGIEIPNYMQTTSLSRSLVEYNRAHCWAKKAIAIKLIYNFYYSRWESTGR